MLKAVLSTTITGINFSDTYRSPKYRTRNLVYGRTSLKIRVLGIETRKLNGETLKMTGDPLIISAKGISKIKISKMHKEKSINLKEYHIAICRGARKIKFFPIKFF